jgi:Uma2 family endonuclease
MATFAVSEQQSAVETAQDSNASSGIELLLDLEFLPIVLQMPRRLDIKRFERFSRVHEPLRMEMRPNGDICVMTPVTGKGGRLNSRLTSRLDTWAEKNEAGVTFDSSVGFRLPDSSVLSPDGAWMSLNKWQSLSSEQQDEFPPACPEFVIELRSKSDRLAELQAKMEQWIANGAQLAWLIDPLQKQATIYRAGRPPEVLQAPIELKGEKPVAGFVLPMQDFWA